MDNNAGIRAQFRILVAALWTAITATLLFAGVDLPDFALAAWGGLYFAASGFLEALYDSRKKRPAPPPPTDGEGV